MNDAEMLAAVKAVEHRAGGLVVVRDQRVLAAVPLPIAGLLSPLTLEDVVKQMEEALAAAQMLGSSLRNPFMTLSFLALPVIPALKLTDRGLVDVHHGAFVPLLIDG